MYTLNIHYINEHNSTIYWLSAMVLTKPRWFNMKKIILTAMLFQIFLIPNLSSAAQDFKISEENNATVIYFYKPARIHLSNNTDLHLRRSLQLEASYPGLSEKSICSFEIHDFHGISHLNTIPKFLSQVQIHVNGVLQHEPYEYTKTGSLILNIKGKSLLYAGIIEITSKSELSIDGIIFGIFGQSFNSLFINARTCGQSKTPESL